MVGSRHHVPKTYHIRRRAVAEARWYVCVCNPQHEERAAAGLRAVGVNVFMPERAAWRIRYKRKERYTRPLFRGYLLMGVVEDSQIYDIRGVDGVERILRDPTTEVPVQVPRDVVQELALACASGCFDTTLPEPAPPLPAAGSPVEVVTGPFQGWRGVVEAALSPKAVKILLPFFGQETIAELTLADLRPVC